MKDELGDCITKVQGTGLLLSTDLDPARFQSYGTNSTEEYMRHHGINVIHGGTNALRYTPPLDITSAEVDLIVKIARDAIVNGPAKETDATSEAA
jgi:4-aminobutyrate aminotransferase-like enzyme